MGDDHRIRLRGGWEWVATGAEGGGPRRVTLPLLWPAARPGRVQLVRRFQRPPVDLVAERVSLELENIEGTVEVRLNGRVIAAPGAVADRIHLALDEVIRPRNELVLEVVPPPVDDPGRAWGEVALVITPRES